MTFIAASGLQTIPRKAQRSRRVGNRFIGLRCSANRKLTLEASPWSMTVVTDHDRGGFAAAVHAGLGWGMLPESLAAPQLADGSFVQICDVHLDVPLYWQCWKLDSPMIDRITHTLRSATADLRRRPARRRSRNSPAR
jgi:DNA-binding transcriptional LysR family regulator